MKTMHLNAKTPAATPLELTCRLLQFNTVNPPGNERPCAEFLAGILEKAGFAVTRLEFAEQRTCLVADLEGEGLPICFSGHIDTVPLGSRSWRRDPFAGDVEGDKLFGRGASDMKSGLAAMVHAALRIAALPGRRAGMRLVLTAGEENGCEGANFLAAKPETLGKAGALIIGEPSANVPLLGHKGAFWLDAAVSGKSAHGSMPEQGDNAIYKAAAVVSLLEAYRFKTVAHPVLGAPTLNVGTISGGTHYNLVPDRAKVGIDIRTIPGLDGQRLMLDLQAYLGEHVLLERVTGADSVFTEDAHPWVQDVFDLLAGYLQERPVAQGATYFTDAGALKPAMGDPPTIILGPGEAHMAHKTDEFCHIGKLEAAAEIYFEIARRWCEG